MTIFSAPGSRTVTDVTNEVNYRILNTYNWQYNKRLLFSTTLYIGKLTLNAVDCVSVNIFKQDDEHVGESDAAVLGHCAAVTL